MSGEFVKVIVRCRPLNEKELEKDVEVVVNIENDVDQQIIVRRACEYTIYGFFDFCYF